MSNYTSGVKNRRIRTIKRLEDQLKKGTKVTKDSEILENGKKGYHVNALSEKDIARIEKELSTLKSRV